MEINDMLDKKNKEKNLFDVLASIKKAVKNDEKYALLMVFSTPNKKGRYDNQIFDVCNFVPSAIPMASLMKFLEEKAKNEASTNFNLKAGPYDN